MPPKDKKLSRSAATCLQKKAKKAPPYQTADADMQQFGVKVGQLVRNGLGCPATVLGVKASADGAPQLWVRYASGQEAPVETLPTAAAGFHQCSAAEQLQHDIAARQQEQQVLDAKWQAYNEEQARKQAEAQKAAAKRKKNQAAAAGALAAGEQGGIAAVPAATEGRESTAGRSRQMTAA